MMSDTGAAGMAALSIAEVLILLLLEKGVLKPADIIEALENCIDAHQIGGAEVRADNERQRHAEAAHLIERLILGRNLDTGPRQS